jgi:hypothetical protein
VIARHASRSAAVLALLAVLPSTAEAKGHARTAFLKGQIVGTPYVAGNRSAIPVLLSKQTARRAGLRTPVGVVILPRTRPVATPAGKVKPGNLRLGDRFHARGVITMTTRRAAYPRIAMRSLRVTRRGKTLSNEELQVLVVQLRTDLTNLQTAVGGLTAYTVAQLQTLGTALAGLRSSLADLEQRLAGLSGPEVDAMNAILAAVKADVDGLCAAPQVTIGLVTIDLASYCTAPVP